MATSPEEERESDRQAGRDLYRTLPKGRRDMSESEIARAIMEEVPGATYSVEDFEFDTVSPEGERAQAMFEAMLEEQERESAKR